MRQLIGELMSELRGPGFLGRFGEDVRFGLRVFHRTPGLTATILLTLALGIGAMTAVFSIVQAVLPPAIALSGTGATGRDLGRTRA